VASLDHPVDEESNADDCQHDKAKRELQDRFLCRGTGPFRNSPAVEEEEWGEKQQEEISGSSATPRLATDAMASRSQSEREVAVEARRYARESALTTTASRTDKGNGDRLHALPLDA